MASFRGKILQILWRSSIVLLKCILDGFVYVLPSFIELDFQDMRWDDLDLIAPFLDTDIFECESRYQFVFFPVVES